MDTIVQCTHCAKKLRVKGALAGRTAKCPACGGLLHFAPSGTELDTAPESKPAQNVRPVPAAVPPVPEPARQGWTVGARVLATWQDEYLYPATIVAVERGGCRVHYDDGDELTVPAVQLQPIAVQVGERIFIRPRKETRLMYYPAIVRRVDGETVDVEFEASPWTTAYVETNLPLGRARFRRGPGSMPGRSAAPQAAPSSLYGVGDRVLARWNDLWWYPATIVAVDAYGHKVLYDDGDQKSVPEEQLMPITVEEGERIFIRPPQMTQLVYFPAIVTRVDGETVDVDFEANDHMEAKSVRNLKVARARFWRCPRGVGRAAWHEGDRVLVLLDYAFWYPAEIVSVEDDRVGVQLLVGGDVFVTPELIRKLEVSAGAKVECRWQGDDQYYPGTLVHRDGDRIRMHYDDGTDETTVIRLIRLRHEG